jgi:hypothetical protein
MHSAAEHPSVVQAYIDSEVGASRLAGPYPIHSISNLMVSRFGVIPKHHKPGKWRLVVDLSSPDGFSVNDGIAAPDCSMIYSSLDDAARFILLAGKGALLAKIDIANAFRIIPVHPDDRHLLGMRWKNSVYVDTRLPLGLCSAPILFNAYADALEWILHQQGITSVLHYLDDFLVIGSPGSSQCSDFLQIMLSTCSMLGVPLANEKIEGPTLCLSFLGIELNTVLMEARLPQDKLDRLVLELSTWQSKRACTRKDLEHLIGLLQFTCKVVPQGRPFVRRMIDLLCMAHQPHHFVCLNSAFRSDLLWWKTFVESWNGISLLSMGNAVTPYVNVFSDASGSFGCGAVWGTLWCQGEWPLSWKDVNIMAKEMVPVVVASALWGSHWSSHHVCFHVDNLAVVAALNKGSSKEPSDTVMHLLRCLFFFAAHHRFTFRAAHVPGHCNVIADAILRNYPFSSFSDQMIQWHQDPCPIPPATWSLLVVNMPDWTSSEWRKLFKASIL